jgi:hypothetical protein
MLVNPVDWGRAMVEGRIMIWWILAGIVWFAAVLAWDLISDGHKYNREETIQHTKEWWLRIAVMFPSCLFFALAAGENFFSWSFIWALFASGMFVGSWFWILFDGLYNTHIIGREDFWAVIGTTSKLDQFLQTIGRTNARILKIAVASIWTIIYLIAIF